MQHLELFLVGDLGFLGLVLKDELLDVEEPLQVTQRVVGLLLGVLSDHLAPAGEIGALATEEQLSGLVLGELARGVLAKEVALVVETH